MIKAVIGDTMIASDFWPEFASVICFALRKSRQIASPGFYANEYIPVAQVLQKRRLLRLSDSSDS